MEWKISGVEDLSEESVGGWSVTRISKMGLNCILGIGKNIGLTKNVHVLGIKGEDDKHFKIWYMVYGKLETSGKKLFFVCLYEQMTKDICPMQSAQNLSLQSKWKKEEV